MAIEFRDDVTHSASLLHHLHAGGANAFSEARPDDRKAEVMALLGHWASFRDGLRGDRRQVANLFAAYRRLDEKGCVAVLEELTLACCLSDVEARAGHAISTYASAENAVERWRALRRLRELVTAPFLGYFAPLCVDGLGIQFLLKLRADASRYAREYPVLTLLDRELQDLFVRWFDPGFLTVREVSWSAPASLLEKLIEYEAVHPMRSWADLRDRLDRDRRCYALFHPGIPDEPLAFVELALLDRLHSSIQTILDEGAPRFDSKGARVAMFYSISNTQPGLRGIGLGALLIERALELLREELPQLRTFVTLSPVPLLAQWLRDNAESMVGLIRAEEASDLCALASDDLPHRALLRLIDTPEWHQNERIQSHTRPVLLRLAAHYLLKVRRANGPWDPVARFHLENGARLEHVHWLADRSPRGLRQSAGIMVSYRYEPTRLTCNRRAYAQTGAVKAAMSVRRLSRVDAKN